MPRVSWPVEWEVVGPFNAVDAGAVSPHCHGEIRSRTRLMDIVDGADVLLAALEAFAAHPPSPQVFDLDRFSWTRVTEEHFRLFGRL